MNQNHDKKNERSVVNKMSAKIKDNNRSVRNVFVRVSISPEEYKYIRIKRLKKLTMRVVSCTCKLHHK